MIYYVTFEIVFLTCCGYALWKGGGPERFAAIALVVAATATLFVITPAAKSFSRIEIGNLIVDVALLLAMLWLALAAERLWPIWMVVMEIAQVSFHIAMLLPLDVDRWAYRRAVAIMAYPMLLTLAIGTRAHLVRLASNGRDLSWRSSWRRWPAPRRPN